VTESTKHTHQPIREPSRTDASRQDSGFERDRVSENTRKQLVRLAFRFVWNLDDAEDAVQEALHTAEAKRSQLRVSAKWWSWLCKIVVQKCHTQGRQDSTRRRHLERYRLERPADSSSHAELSAESQALRAVLPKLPPRQRDVLVLRHLQGIDDAQISEILGIAPSTVRVHARAAKESLCTLLKQRHPDWFESGGAS